MLQRKLKNLQFFLISFAKPPSTPLSIGLKLRAGLLLRLYRLPEIKKADKRIDSFSHHKHGISFLTQKKPANIHDYYEIHAGYNGPERFETYFIYYIYGPKWVIKEYDTFTGKSEPVREPS